MSDQNVLVIGKESVGKSALIASLTGREIGVSNFRGSTVECTSYRLKQGIAKVNSLIDTPGILRRSDAETTRMALSRLREEERVLVVAQATRLDDDLRDLLPLLDGKKGAVAVTFWDKVHGTDGASESLLRLSQAAGLSFVPVDARKLSDGDRARVLDAIDDSRPFPNAPLVERVGWRIEPPPGWLDRPVLGPLLAMILLLVPSATAVYAANWIAGIIDPIVRSWIAPAIASIQAGPDSVLKAIVVGSYGLATMGPALVIWALPTVLLFSLWLAVLKTSGLIDRMNIALDPLVRPLGLAGRDVARIVMGFGCNVPAVIATRASSSCSRGACISAIAFGSACSYQFPATLAVFAAAGAPQLVIPYLLFLFTTTVIYLRCTAPAKARSPLNVLVLDGRNFLELPRLGHLWREASASVRQFAFQAMPVFLLVSAFAAVLDYVGALTWLDSLIRPAMAVFQLPPEAALPIALSSLRKDGILLFCASSEGAGLRAPMSAWQVLVGVYLAGVLVPCLVTAWTAAREQSWRFAGGMLLRQASFAVLFSVILGWTPVILGWSAMIRQ